MKCSPTTPSKYYAHVSNFPIYISATHSRCDDIKVRQLLLENLNDEEKGEENHPELWMRFAEGLGPGARGSRGRRVASGNEGVRGDDQITD